MNRPQSRRVLAACLAAVSFSTVATVALPAEVLAVGTCTASADLPYRGSDGKLWAEGEFECTGNPQSISATVYAYRRAGYPGSGTLVAQKSYSNPYGGDHLNVSVTTTCAPTWQEWRTRVKGSAAYWDGGASDGDYSNWVLVACT